MPRNFNNSQLQPGEIVLINRWKFQKKIERFYYAGSTLNMFNDIDNVIALIEKRDKYALLHVQYIDQRIQSKFEEVCRDSYGVNQWRVNELFRYELKDIDEIL